MTDRSNTIAAPLFGFHSDVDSFDFSEEVLLSRGQYSPTEQIKRYALAPSEINELHESSHIVEVTLKHDDVGPTELIHALLIAIHLHGPSKAQVRFKFSDSGFSRLMTRFHFNPNEDHITTYPLSTLREVRATFTELVKILRKRGRLYTALYMTYQTFSSYAVGPAIIEAATALEALFTYGTGHGITRRLASAYAGVVSEGDEDARPLYLKCEKVYNARSDFLHGRSLGRTAEQNLDDLALANELLRQAWLAILTRNDGYWVAILEGSDKERRKHLVSFEKLSRPRGHVHRGSRVSFSL